MTKAEKKQYEQDLWCEDLLEKGFNIKADGENWWKIEGTKDGQYYGGYKRKTNALKRAQELSDWYDKCENDRVDRLNDLPVLSMCRKANDNFKPIRELVSFMSDKVDALPHDSDTYTDVVETLEYLNDDLDLMETRLKTLDKEIISLMNDAWSDKNE